MTARRAVTVPADRIALVRSRRTPAESKLIVVVLRQQYKRGMTDTEFADLLGVPQSTWSRTGSGAIPLGMRVLGAVTRQFPHMNGYVLSVLRSSMPIGIKDSE